MNQKASLTNLNTFGNPGLILKEIWMKFCIWALFGKLYSPPFPVFFKTFNQKVWFPYQLGVKNTYLLVKNLITNIRTKFKVFLDPFSSYFPYFIIFSHFLDSWINFSSKI